MQIAVLSDTHDNVWVVERLLPELKGAGLLIFCGDLCAPFTLRLIAEGFAGPVHATFGNNDGDILLLTQVAAKQGNVTFAAPMGELEAGGRRLAFVHYPQFGEGLAALGRYDAVFAGHTHRPELRTIGKTLFANPGAVIGRDRPPTYGIYDTETGTFRHHTL
ncbi:MAG: metallophosphoesterase [Anaerolineae bacterium]|nr:metallophosphoesterase [Anaerolineae bacterium]